jgi:hypothetical protein
MIPSTSLTKAQRAQENRAYIRELLWKRQPVFAAALAAAEQDFSCSACPCKQREMIARKTMGESYVTRNWLLLVVRQLARRTSILRRDLPQVRRSQARG